MKYPYKFFICTSVHKYLIVMPNRLQLRQNDDRPISSIYVQVQLGMRDELVLSKQVTLHIWICYSPDCDMEWDSKLVCKQGALIKLRLLHLQCLSLVLIQNFWNFIKFSFRNRIYTHGSIIWFSDTILIIINSVCPFQCTPLCRT